MLAALEQLLAQKFSQLPLAARVVAYFVLLFAFVYLLMVPRFIDGQIVAHGTDPGSGLIPYRGGQIQTQIAGRTYKFVADEEGYFSIPLVSLVPHRIELQVLHADRSEWFPVTFGAADAWSSAAQRIVVSDGKPFVHLEQPEAPLKRLAQAMAAPIATAMAAELVVPRVGAAAADRNRVLAEVTGVVARVTRRPGAAISPTTPFSAPGGPSYVQRIEIVGFLEHRYAVSIPDEHWKAVANVGELADYVTKRQALRSAYPKLRGIARSWPEVQQALPEGERPVFIQ